MLPVDPAPYQHLCPNAVEGFDIRGVKLTPEQVFVWTLTDGVTTLTQMADVTNLSVAAVFVVLRELEQLGAVVWPEESAVQAISGMMPPAGTATACAPSADHPALAEAGDLSYDERWRVLTVENALAKLTFWQLLGVDGSATTADIDRAFAQASKVFAVDRYFGKKLGSFAARLEKINHALQSAHQVLAQPAQRAAYAAQHPPAPYRAAPGAV